MLDSPLASEWDVDEAEKSLERIVRKSARSQIKDWQTASIYPVVGYHPKYMVTPELIGVAVVGTPWKSEETATYLYAMEDELPEGLIDWIDQVMDLGDGLDCACKIMLNYQRAIIPVNGESLDLWDEIFQDVLDGKRSTNYHKLCKQNQIKVVSTKSTNLLTHNSVIQMDIFSSSFRRDWA
jgi:hypothetical protein